MWTKTQEGEDSILIRLAQRHVAHLPKGVRLSEATREQLTEAVKRGMRADRTAGRSRYTSR